MGLCGLASSGCIDPRPATERRAGRDEVLSDAGALPLAPPELMENGGYELGLLAWEVVAGGELSVSSQVFHRGSASALLTARARAADGIGQRMGSRLTPGQRYHARVFVAVGGLALDGDAGAPPSTYLASLSVSHNCGLPSFDLIDQRATTPDGWTELGAAFLAPPCFDGDSMLYVDGPESGVDLFVDSGSLIAVDDEPRP